MLKETMKDILRSDVMVLYDSPYVLKKTKRIRKKKLIERRKMFYKVKNKLKFCFTRSYEDKINNL
jgi:hypothetical protein